jgi:hypothetical protein
MRAYARLSELPDAKFKVARVLNASGARDFIAANNPMDFYELMPPGMYHEVIQYPGRIVLDIDNAEFDAEIVRQAILNVPELSHFKPTIIHMTKPKMKDSKSHHVVIHLMDGHLEYMVANRSIVKSVAVQIPGADLGIYRRNSTLRLPMSPKPGNDDDYYEIPSKCHITDCIATPPTTCNIVGKPEEIQEERRKESMKITLGESEESIWIDSKVADAFETQQIGLNKWNLRRINPSYCPLCKRTHENIDQVIERSGSKFWLKCPRYNAAPGAPRAKLLGVRDFSTN